jgi:hypothetical protein
MDSTCIALETGLQVILETYLFFPTVHFKSLLMALKYLVTYPTMTTCGGNHSINPIAVYCV